MKKFLLLLLLLIAIALLAYYCTHRMNSASIIQNDINTRAQAALDKQNMGWANLAVDGRDITLSGSAPSEEAKDAADQAVRIDGYNLIDNQLSVGDSEAPDAPQQNPDQADSSQTDTTNTDKPEEQVPLKSDDDDKTIENEQKATETPTEEQKASNTPPEEEAPIKQAKASKDCQAKFNQILKTPIYFKTSSDSVQKKSITVLNKLALAAEECASFNLVIHGHSDSTGKASLNKKLSHGRAKAVVKYLIGKEIDSKRLAAQGHGSSKPIASNKTDAGRARNRRIEITIEDKQ
jgi:outer membrane protein OmpA-like peptidoglycan-associated protein